MADRVTRLTRILCDAPDRFEIDGVAYTQDHIAACVKACASIPTELLENIARNVTRRDCLAALSAVALAERRKL